NEFLTVTHKRPPPLSVTQGSVSPTLCPLGTMSAAFGLSSDGECAPCDPGFYCPENGAVNATVPCLEGFFCPGGDAYPTMECPTGNYCPTGSSVAIDCAASTYQNDTGQSECDLCPPGYYCEMGESDPLPCPAGHYCPEGTAFGNQYLCPNGTYSNTTTLASLSECFLCPPG
ncbi:unnamed protein product, partial [Sphacelaria rigidula]